MKTLGMILLATGMILCFGAVGTLDIDPDANVAVQVGLALLGLTIMHRGVQFARG